MKELAKKDATYVQYKFDRATSKLPHFDGPQSSTKDVDGCISRLACVLKAGIARFCDPPVENLPLDLHDCLSAAFPAFQTPTTTIRDLNGEAIHETSTCNDDGSTDLI